MVTIGEKDMKFLIAGFGSIGRRHFRNLRSLGENDILFYRTNQSTLPDDEIKAYQVETDLQRALAYHPTAVIISNPTAFHLKVAIPAVEAGCHVLLEKPISHSMDGVETFVRLVQEKDVQVLVGYQFRFHPGLQKIKSLLNEQVLGKVISVNAHWGEYLPGWHPWENYKQSYSARADLGGGVVLTLSHPLDYLRWLFGEVESVSGFVSTSGDLGIEVEDTAVINLKFENGMLGSVYLDYNQRPASHRLEIIGSEGTIQWDYKDGAVRWYQSAKGQNNVWHEYKPPKDFDRNTMFLSQMEHFLNVINGKELPRCTLHDGVRALQIAMAVYESAKSKRVVSVI